MTKNMQSAWLVFEMRIRLAEVLGTKYVPRTMKAKTEELEGKNSVYAFMLIPSVWWRKAVLPRMYFVSTVQFRTYSFAVSSVLSGTWRQSGNCVSGILDVDQRRELCSACTKQSLSGTARVFLCRYLLRVEASFETSRSIISDWSVASRHTSVFCFTAVDALNLAEQKWNE